MWTLPVTAQDPPLTNQSRVGGRGVLPQSDEETQHRGLIHGKYMEKGRHHGDRQHAWADKTTHKIMT